MWESSAMGAAAGRQASDCTFVPKELPVTWDGNGPGCSEMQPQGLGLLQALRVGFQ